MSTCILTTFVIIDCVCFAHVIPNYCCSFQLVVLLDLFELVQQQEARVVLIATAQNKQQLNSDLLQSRGVHVFEKILEIKPPTLVSRIAIGVYMYNGGSDNYCAFKFHCTNCKL